MNKIKTFFNNFNISLIKDPQILEDKRKRILSLVVFYFSAFVVFMTMMSQMPVFSSRGLTKIFQVGWIILLIPMIMLDYRHFLRSAANCLLILIPFLLYCIIAYFCGINSIKYRGTTCIFLATYMIIIGAFYGKYFNIEYLRGIAIAYILGAALYAGIVYINKLRGYDIDNPIYAFDDKNSAGPIFLTAALLTFIVFKKKNTLTYIIKVLSFCYFASIIVLAKCRATIVFLPIALLLIHIFLPSNNKAKLISRIAFPSFIAGCMALIWFVPSLHQKIIINIIMNGKPTIREAFAGRIDLIIDAMKNLKLVAGNGGHYIDCMPVSFLSTYGIIGLISMLPIAIIPFYMIIKGRKTCNKDIFIIEITILSLLAFNSLLEGYGYIGPGAKVFILWIITGYSYYYVTIAKNENSPYNFIDKPAAICNKIKPVPFLFAFQILLIVGSCGLIYSKNIANQLGAKYVSILPENNKKAEYIAPTDMQISEETRNYLGSSGGLCTGQKIKFKHTLEPNNATDYWANWLTAWSCPEAINVDISTGVVEAVAKEPTPTMVQVFFPTCGDYSRYIEFSIVKPEDFEFKNGMIDIKPFEYSFDISEESKKDINISTNQTIKLYYDTNYVPIKEYFTFEVSKGAETATIDSTTGVFKAAKSGEYKVRGKITNPKGTYYTNEINIIAKDSEKEFVEVESIAFDNVEELKNNAFQNQPIEIKPKWTGKNGKEPTDKEFDIIVEKDDTNYIIDEQKHTILFKNDGDAKITIKSRSDSSKQSETINVTVKNNPLVKFTCDDDWILVGETQDMNQIGLYLEYKNGYRKLVDENDLLITNRGSGRASSNGTGFINGTFTTIKGIATGDFSYTYVAKDDSNITYNLYLTSSVFTKVDYNTKVSNSGLVMIFFVVILLTPFLLFVDIKKKWLYLIIAALYCLAIILFTFYIYAYTAYSMSCLIVFVSIVFLLSLLKLTLLNNKAIQFVDKE